MKNNPKVKLIKEAIRADDEKSTKQIAAEIGISRVQFYWYLNNYSHLRKEYLHRKQRFLERNISTIA